MLLKPIGTFRQPLIAVLSVGEELLDVLPEASSERWLGRDWDMKRVSLQAARRPPLRRGNFGGLPVHTHIFVDFAAECCKVVVFFVVHKRMASQSRDVAAASWTL